MDEWTLAEVERLLKKLDEQNILADVKDVIWVLDKIQDPADEDQEYFKELATT